MTVSEYDKIMIDKKDKEIEGLKDIIRHLGNKFIAIAGNTDPIAVNHIMKLIDDVLK